MFEKSKWQWIDDNYGPMGWFSDAAKRRCEGAPGFENGHFRALSATETESMGAYVGALAYEQA